MVDNRLLLVDGIDPPGLEVVVHHEDHRVGEDVVDETQVFPGFPVRLVLRFQLADVELR